MPHLSIARYQPFRWPESVSPRWNSSIGVDAGSARSHRFDMINGDACFAFWLMVFIPIKEKSLHTYSYTQCPYIRQHIMFRPEYRVKVVMPPCGESVSDHGVGSVRMTPLQYFSADAPSVLR
jgi:hypothetical protein